MVSNKFWSKREQIKRIKIAIKVCEQYKGKEVDELRLELITSLNELMGK